MNYLRKNSRSILAARMKSFSVRPSILCVYVFTSTRPQVSNRSGWCPSASATAPARFTNARAVLKSGNTNVLVRRCSAVTFQSGNSADNFSNSSPLSGGTPPLQGTGTGCTWCSGPGRSITRLRAGRAGPGGAGGVAAPATSAGARPTRRTPGCSGDTDNGADFLGKPDLPHTYSPVPDIAGGLATLGTDTRAGPRPRQAQP